MKIATTKVVLPITTQLVASAAMLGARLKKARIDAQLTQAELAKLAKVSQQLITRIESGDVLETRKLVQIAAALGKTAEELSGKRYPPASQPRTDSVKEPMISLHGFRVTIEAARLASEWDKLRDVAPDAAMEFQMQLETKLAGLISDGRKRRKRSGPGVEE